MQKPVHHDYERFLARIEGEQELDRHEGGNLAKKLVYGCRASERGD